MKKNQIVIQDCLSGFKKIDSGVVDLAFADPPFNIGYKYDKYDDNRTCDDYLDWSSNWMKETKRILKPTGAFWLAIGDEYAAELKVLATREIGFHCRSWVIWYYTFGVHCHSKFTRSHAHLFHFVVNPEEFVFNDNAIRVPSARQLVYGDKRANPKGRVPDDTWVMRPTPEESWLLRPQDLPEGFSADSDSWYFPRVCGTFKERQGFHGCQMPEQLLSRIIKACSNSGDLVFDPFVGSGTTLAVAKKLGRDYLGFELSSQYAKAARSRLGSIKVGDSVNGKENPLLTGILPKIVKNGQRRKAGIHSQVTVKIVGSSKIRGLAKVDKILVSAFESTCSGYSLDRLLADPNLNEKFISRVEKKLKGGNAFEWNKRLLNLRKANKLKTSIKAKRTRLDAEKINACEFASEIALIQVQKKFGISLDDVLCDPETASEFDQLAYEIAPGFTPLDYRWAALRIRKYSNDWRKYGKIVKPEFQGLFFANIGPLKKVLPSDISVNPGLYRLNSKNEPLYIGETANLREWFKLAVFGKLFASQKIKQSDVTVGTLTIKKEFESLSLHHGRRGIKSIFIRNYSPKWNHPHLAVA